MDMNVVKYYKWVRLGYTFQAIGRCGPLANKTRHKCVTM